MALKPWPQPQPQEAAIFLSQNLVRAEGIMDVNGSELF